MNRLVSENDTVYTFDDFGNRKTMTDGEATTTYTYDLNNRLLESNEVAGDAEVNTKYFYDANGNQTTKAVMSSEAYDGAGAGHTVSGDTNEYIAIYDYNCYNQLVGVDTNGVISSYAYLPDGMRLSKTVGTDTTTFVYDGANIVEEITANGVNKYYRGIEIIKNDDNVYYLYNGQGDVAILTDSAGNIVANYIFDAYGNTDSENSVYNNFGYRGEYSDAESGLIYLRARMYDPSVGRFINEDPIRDGLNWYVYCGGNPVMFVDPTGCILQEEIDLYNKGQLSQDVYDILVDLGNRWENAKTDAARDEIHNLAEQFRNNNYKYQDLSNEANAQLWENGQKMYLMRNAGFDMLTDTIALAGTGLKWYSLVDNDKLWDYKERPALWMPKEEYFMMYGKLISFADFGNINYGYTGTVLGLSPETLYKGAGYVQSGVVNNYASQYYGDSEVDFGNVKRGIEWANSSGYVGIISLPLKLIFGVKEAITP